MPASFWNATEGCCNHYQSTVDDVAYLRPLICHAQANYSIDPDRVYVIGYSNGGFMAHRMVCEASDLITAIISIAGVTWDNPWQCLPTHPVSVLQIHGTSDDRVHYEGMEAFAPGSTPSAAQTYEAWAAINGCAGPNQTGAMIDLDLQVNGVETSTVHKAQSESCQVRTEFWSVAGGSHGPAINPIFRQFFVDWFLATPANHD